MTSTLMPWLDNPYIVFLGWVLALALWETTAVGVALAGWLAWRPRSTARYRYTAAVIALSAAVVVAVSAPLQLLRLQRSSPRAARVLTSSSHDQATAATSSVGAVSPSTRVADRGSERPRVSLATLAGLAALVWMLGVLLLAARALGGWWLAHSIAGRAAPVQNETVLSAADGLGATVIAGYPIPILESNEVEAPVVLGWRAPRLILPHDAAERLSVDMIAALLAHEFAHIRRRDYAANLAQSAVEAILFFSPLVIWISRRIREAREFCCDDAAVDRCGDPKPYVEALTILASLGAVNAARPALGAVGPRLITRIRRLLQGEAMPRFQHARLIGLAVLFVAIVAAGVQLLAASAARAPRLSTDSSSPARLQDKIPYGFAHEQAGSGVDLHRFDSTLDEPARMAAIKNVSNQPIVGVRFTAAVERWTTVSRMPTRVFVSPLVSVTVPPGQTVEVAPNVLTAAQVQEVAADSPGATIQLFFGLQSVRFANGYEWNTVPNLSAFTGPDVLNIPRPVYSRSLITRDAGKPLVSFGACRDEQNRATSHGGRVPILNEPGRAMVCDNGRWIDAPPSGR